MRPEYRTSWVVKIESAPTSFDLCSPAGWGCFSASHQVKPPDNFGQIGVFGLLAIILCSHHEYVDEMRRIRSGFSLLLGLQ
ncbi:hypothetical protein AVEN_79835-1 [Araneus ventricosus]|uniref:Uncharacterized protein n=1 Tax=Araneus ventricosus TaxID=182803 RepID=A0A4Y2EXJ1_ARAVE|nr:hypothetical protein AVEN_79835-1 [Araneus ventricosus]